jgi:3-hydroxyacyl-CoA dehydrogenase
MIERKWLGNKTGQGFYKPVEAEEGRQFWELNLDTLEYEPPSKPYFKSVGEFKEVEDVGERIKGLCNAAWGESGRTHDRAGQYIWTTTAFTLNYAASLIPEVADDIVAIDQANRWGFNHALGPFELWDALGVAETVARMEADGMEVTPWVKEMLAHGNTSFYRKDYFGQRAYYDPLFEDYVSLEPDPRIIVLKDLKDEGRVVAGNDSADLIDLGDGVLCLEFHTKVNALDQDIFRLMDQAREELEKDWVGLVIGNQGEHFCAGANIFALAMAAYEERWDELNAMMKQAQDALMAFRYSPKPVVSAPFGMVLGGGAEVMMAASATCAAAESYIGQVEAGVGLVPAAGGCKELLRRVVSPIVKQNPYADVQTFVRQVFEMVALAKVSASAVEARQWGFLAPTDRIVMNGDHLLAEAKAMVLEMAKAGYRPPVRSEDQVWAVGANGLAALQMLVWGQKEAGYASEHDALIANKTAYILCGGKLSRPQWVDPQYILDLEREAFLSLLGEQKTIDRIWHMLNTGQPLRN